MRKGTFALALALGLFWPSHSTAQVYSRTDVTVYHDDLDIWVLGQVESSTNMDTTMTESRTVYDAATAMPLQILSFEKLQQTLTYNADGTVATVSDGRDGASSVDTTVTLSAWKRGIPQSIRFPATPESPNGSVRSAVVNDDGTIASTTDENGYLTAYSYDPMGRLSKITYPANDTVAWTPKSFEFRALTTADWKPPGVIAGQWRQFTTQGRYAKATYFDAMWRPVLVHEYDESVGGTLRSTSTSYDASGRVAFQSYPSADLVPPATGIWTFYDALDRMTSVKQDSELGQLATTTEYLTGFRTRVTNPRGFATTTSYMAYDEPTMDWPVAITHPEGAFTDIVRDVFGKPTSLVRHNAGNSQRVARTYVYNGNQELCKAIEPETGTTFYGFDAAGNLTWTAAGLAFQSTSTCEYVPAFYQGRSVVRTYDQRNRITALTFPDGRGNQTWQYTPDGLPSQMTAYNDSNNGLPVVNAYTYNKRRLLTGESVSQPGWYNWGLGYSYDGNGSLQGQSYPTGLYVDYAPNALGQATKAGTYATGVSYYPNGGIKQFTYGNGIVHTMTQNTRQLPARTTDAGVLDFDNRFDANGNSTDTYDLALGGVYNLHRYYDGLDRLVSAGSWKFGGDGWHRFTYDTLDNLKSWKLAGVKDYANYYYDASNRLTNIQNTSGASIVGLGYDVQGNLQNKNGQNYSFDYGNRLREVTGKEYYRYDAHGRRVLAWAPNQGSILSQYGQAGQLLYQHDERKTKQFEYIYLAGSLVGVHEYNWSNNSYATKYQHTDALGSPVAVSIQSAQVIERTQWEPYGAAVNRAVDGVGYAGQVMDAATGLTYMQQRYFDPYIGRFLSSDPVTAYRAPVDAFNRYWYAKNNPYKFKDPDGRSACLGGFCDQGTTSDQLPEINEAHHQSSQESGKPEVTDLEPVKVTAPKSAVARQPSKTLRSKWERFYNRVWPKDPNNPGRNQDVAHKDAVADGGDPNDPENYDPKPHDEHMQEHKDNGDFKRWGARSRAGVRAPEVVPAPTGVPEVPMAEPVPEIFVPEIFIP